MEHKNLYMSLKNNSTKEENYNTTKKFLFWSIKNIKHRFDILYTMRRMNLGL